MNGVTDTLGQTVGGVTGGLGQTVNGLTGGVPAPTAPAG